MKNQKNKIIKGGIYLSLIIFGYLLARLITNLPYLEFAKQIDITNILSLILTFWLAIIVTTVFEKQNNNHRVEKDLMITRVGNIYDIVESLQIGSNSGQIHLSETNSSLKRINMSLNSIYSIINKCKLDISNDLKEKIKSCLGDLRNVLTSTPSVTEEQLKSVPIEIKDSIIHYNRERISQIEIKFESLKNLLLEFQIEINKK